MDIATREFELAHYLEKQPYQVEQDGIRLNIAKNVFPSDFGLTSRFVGRYILQQPPAKRALDMGCGSGYFAFLLKKIGCESVTGIDLNPDAVNCAQSNCALNPELGLINFVQSNLFNSIAVQRFDLIVFNFNYYPSNGVFGLYADGGREILERFFSEVSAYIEPNIRIYIPYSAFVGPEHDPRNIAPQYGFSVSIVDKTHTQTGDHFIYLITQR